jgi:hypothetical protein
VVLSVKEQRKEEKEGRKKRVKEYREGGRKE